jgi:hypothetical protein
MLKGTNKRKEKREVFMVWSFSFRKYEVRQNYQHSIVKVNGNSRMRTACSLKTERDWWCWVLLVPRYFPVHKNQYGHTEIHPRFGNYEFIGVPTGPALVFVLGPNRE